MIQLAVYVTALVYLCLAAFVLAQFPRRYLTGLAVLNAGFAIFAWVLAASANGVYFNYDGYFGDFWTATEALNKARYGLLSSVDFFSPIGPVYYYVYAVITSFDSTPTAASVLHASALLGCVAAVLSILILWRQVSLLGLAVVLFSVVAVAVAGRGNGELLYAAKIHYLAPYNRWAWALFVPVAVSLALPYRPNPVAAVALGVAIAALLMLKVTYGAAAIGLLLGRVMLVPGSWREVPGAAVGCSAVLLVIQFSTGQVTAHLRDLSQLALLSDNGFRFQKLFLQLGEMGLFSLLAIITYLVAVPSLPTRPVRVAALWEFVCPILLILLVAGAGCAVLMQNHYVVEAAIYPLLVLVALEWAGVLRQVEPLEAVAGFRERVLVTTALLFVVFYPIVDTGMHVGQRLQYIVSGPDPEFAGTPYADLRFEPEMVQRRDSRLNAVADGRSGVLSGLDILRRAGADEVGAGRVATLTFANPFPMLLDQPSPSGTPIWLHENRSFSEDIFVDPEVFFRDVDFVLLSPRPSILRNIYQDTLDIQFRQVARSPYWVLMTRRQ